MRSSVWVSLIRILPPEVLEKLMAVMTSGNEINISGVLRFEQDFMVVRGRLAGTTDDASVVFLPYDRIDYMGIRVPMKDAELEAIFAAYQAAPAEMTYAAPTAGAPMLTPSPSLAPAMRIMPAQQPRPEPARSAPEPEPVAPPPVPSAPAAAAAAAAAGPASAILPGKAALLERLRRSRLNQDGPKSSEGK